MELLLSDEEISRVAYERNLLFGENDNLAYTRKPDADKCIAQAQLDKDEGRFAEEKNKLTFELGRVAKDACQERVERIFREIGEYDTQIEVDNKWEWFIPTEAIQALKKEEGI